MILRKNSNSSYNEKKKRNTHMRCILLTAMMLLSLTRTAAQTNDITEGRKEKDPFYLQVFLGVNKSANENLPWSEMSRYPWAMGMFTAVGQEMTDLWGWRAALRHNHNKSRNVPACENPATWGWDNLGLFGDVTFDVSDALAKKPHKLNMKAFAGLGAAYTWGYDDVPLSYVNPFERSKMLLLGVRLGLNASLKLSDNVRLGAELSHSFYGDKFNGVTFSAPYDSRSNLKVGITYLIREKKPRRVVTPQEVERVNRLRECPELPMVVPVAEQVKNRRIVGRAFLDFPVNETVIYPDYRKNPEELAKMCASVDSALFDKSVQITSISLQGFASPESSYANNTRLAKGRTDALKSYLIKKYKFDQQIFKTSYTPEDWENLRSFVADSERRKVKSDVWYDNETFVETPEAPEILVRHKDELLKVIGREMDPDAREEALKQVAGGEPYRWLLQHVYPGLRHTDYIIDYVIRQFPLEQGRRLIYTHPEALSAEEMYQVAQHYKKGSEAWYDAFVIAAKQFPDDETANLNAACASAYVKRLRDARKYLQKAGNTPEAQYVQVVIDAMEGRCNWRMENGKVVLY